MIPCVIVLRAKKGLPVLIPLLLLYPLLLPVLALAALMFKRRCAPNTSTLQCLGLVWQSFSALRGLKIDIGAKEQQFLLRIY